MPDALLDRLATWKRRFGPPDTGQLERLLARVPRRRLSDAGELIRLHEDLLFLRAYPRSREVARQVDQTLFSFADRIAAMRAAGADVSALEEPEVSGIAGTSLTAVFSYEVARSLAERYPRKVEIAWDACDEPDQLGPVAARFLPLLHEDWPVEAHVPYREWITAVRPRGCSDLAWLLERLAALRLTPRQRAELYDALRLPLTWHIANSVSRSRLRLPRRGLYCHREPLLRRKDTSLWQELEGPPLPVRRLPPPESRRILDLILDTSAMRYRELYGFTHPDASRVFHADAGRGVDIFFFGVPLEWRLPLRAYHAGMFFKNGVPAGYVELLSLFEKAEVGFNLYYTFREGESAWLFARLLHLFRQVLGVNCFSVDPYQLGDENSEAIDAGAFWFYRKLGFRPVEPEIMKLVEREESRMRDAPDYRSSKRTLERLARGYVIFEGPSAETGAWDRFSVRNLGLAAERAMAQRSRPLGTASSGGLSLVLNVIPDLARWPKEEKLAAARILQAKDGADEARYLRLMQQHARLRAAFLRLGSSPAS